MNDEPTHLIVKPGDRYVLCGIKRDDAGPRVLAQYTGRHRRGRVDLFNVCAECGAIAVDLGIALDVVDSL